MYVYSLSISEQTAVTYKYCSKEVTGFYSRDGVFTARYEINADNRFIFVLIPASLRGCQGSVPWQSVWDMWWYETGNIHVMRHWGVLMQELWQCESNKYYIFWVCVCSLSYPACDVSGCAIFFFRPIVGMIFWKKLLNIKWVFWIFPGLPSETFLIL